LFAKELRRRGHRPTSKWHLDEMAVLMALSHLARRGSLAASC
jgi:hypothetical protein